MPLHLILGLALLIGAHDAMATLQRTFVASTGDDAHACSLPQPCRSFGAAITQTNVNGEVIVLDSAGYGAVTVTKSVSIIAPPGIYAGISVFAGDGVTVNAPGAIVVLRGLSINGQGGNRGIFLQAAARLRVESCVVSRMGIAGIAHNAAGAEMIVLDTIVRDNGGSGIVVFGDLPTAVLDHVRSEHNGGDGLNFSPTSGSLGARATVVDSVFTHNEGNGIGADSVPGATITIMVERSVMASNGQHGFVANGATGSIDAHVSRNAINDNGGKGIYIQGAGSIRSAVVENAVHRNGEGIRLEWAASAVLEGALKGNVGHTNLGGDLWCNEPVPPGPGKVYTDQTNMFLYKQVYCTVSSSTF